jgi:hypothetical protein
MDLTQTSISQRRGREAARPRAGLIGYLAATVSRVAVASRPLGPGTRQSASAGRRPVAPIADRIADLVVPELIGGTHPGVPL